MKAMRAVEWAALVAVGVAGACLLLLGLTRLNEMLALGGPEARIARLIILLGSGGLLIAMLGAWLDDLGFLRR